MIDLVQYRRFFAEEIEAVAKLQTPGLVDALATVPRERFLRPGPWTVLADTDFTIGAAARERRPTPIRGASLTTSPSRSIPHGTCSTASRAP